MTTTDDGYLEPRDGGTVLRVLVQPRASRSEVIGPHDGRLKLRLKSPPVDGAANKELIAWLSKQLKAPKSAITIESGESARRKRLFVAGISPEQVRRALGL